MNTYQNSIKNKPPYLIGLLCLIPLVGAFVGLVLILYGIYRYKDKWLIIIGAFGILFTIIIYSSLFFYLFNGKIPQEQFKMISKTQLNNVMKDVEFFKIQNGKYPDSLNELKTMDIHDPLQMFNSNGNFNYERIENKYLLFSSGKDGKPNTSDDIYPDLTINDSTKIGLIIRK